MIGTKATSKPLQLAWQGATGPTDAHPEPRPPIAIVGIGRTGTHVIAHLTNTGRSPIHTIALHTDPESLQRSHAHHQILLGGTATRHRGRTRTSLRPLLTNRELVIVTTDLDSVTARRTAPLAAEMARATGALTLAVVTRPHPRPETQTHPSARALADLQHACDTVILIDGRKLLDLHPPPSIDEIMPLAGQVLAHVIRGIIDTVATADDTTAHTTFPTLVRQGGLAAVGLGESTAPSRLEDAVRQALSSPLLDAACTGAKGALIHVTGAHPVTVDDATRAGELVTHVLNTSTPVVWGTTPDPGLSDTLRVTLIMTGVTTPALPIRGDLIAPQLFNLEPHSAPERKLGVDLGLDQLETF
jgi:cell division protein FtsZ